MTKHIHAELMFQYAQDAMETNRPWERWEIIESGRDNQWRDCTDSPLWIEYLSYRRKPKTSRERFELACAEEWDLDINRNSVGVYIDLKTCIAWWAWQEAERQALEMKNDN